MRLVLFLSILCFNSFGQRTFLLDTSETDSIELTDYKIYLVSENIDINFIGREIPKDKRFQLTRGLAIDADNLFKDQYVKASNDQYYKQFHNRDRFVDSTDYEKGKLIYQQTYKRIESNARRDSKKKIKN